MKGLFVIPALLGLSLRLPVASADALLTVGSATAAPGGTVSLPLTLDAEAKNVTGIEVHLNHSAVTPAGGASLAFAALDDKSLSPPLAGALFDSSDSGGVFHVALVHADPVDGPLTLATLKVSIPANATPGATYALSLTAKLSDPDGRSVAVKVAGGTLTVEGQAPAPKRGDVNGDGKLNVADATLALRFVVALASPTAAQVTAADIDGDGKIRINDVTAILRAAVGLNSL